MGMQVCSGAMLPCGFGMAPSDLPTNRVMVENKRAANIMDHMPVVNISTLGMWSAPTNPDVIAATSAALGMPTAGAVHAGDPSAVGARIANSADWQHAYPE